MWKYLYITILIFFAYTTKAQRVKTYTIDDFKFMAYYTSSGGKCTIDSITIQNLAGKQHIPKIIPPRNSCYCGVKYQPLTLEDYNFDNYPDIRIAQTTPAASSTPYIYWLYNPKKKQYIRTFALEEITSPIVDKKKKRINSEWQKSETLFGTSTYKWQDTALVLTQIVEQEYTGDIENGGAYILETTLKPVKDKMKVISRKRKSVTD